MAGGAETPNIAALPAIARLGACESARGPDADRHVKLLIQFAVEGSLSDAYSHLTAQDGQRRPLQKFNRTRDIPACGWEQAPRYLIRDRDGAYGEVFIRRLRSMGIRDRPTSPHSPWQNGYA